MRPPFRSVFVHGGVLLFVFLTLVPFFYVLNNSFRTPQELYRSFFGLPQSVIDGTRAAGRIAAGDDEPMEVRTAEGDYVVEPPTEALATLFNTATHSYQVGWELLRQYMVNTLFVSGATAALVLFFGSLAGYVLSRYRFAGSRFAFLFILSVMMFPGVLLLAPSFMLVKTLGLTNSYWALILPYTAGGQVVAIFVFKSFFDGLPEELFESARIDGAGHIRLYRDIVLPMSKPVMSVVLIMNVLGTWNNFIWPFVVNTNDDYHVLASGLYVLALAQYGQNPSTLYAAYTIASVPLLLLFIYATRPFIQGVTQGAFKA